MKSLLTLTFVLFATSIVYAQGPSVSVDHTTVKVTHPSFEVMCAGFAMKIGEVPASGMIKFKPSIVLPSRVGRAGGVWIIQYANQEFRVNSADLPDALQGLRGPVARNIVHAICYTSDNYFYSTEDVTIVSSSDEGAEQIAKAIH